MSTPSDNRSHVFPVPLTQDQIDQARDMTRQVLDPAQTAEARRFVQWRSGFGEAEDPQTVQRAARILLARDEPGRPARLVEKTLGLPPEGPESADFRDLTRGLDDWAKHIHTPTRFGNGVNGHSGNGDGRHAR